MDTSNIGGGNASDSGSNRSLRQKPDILVELARLKILLKVWKRLPDEEMAAMSAMGFATPVDLLYIPLQPLTALEVRNRAFGRKILSAYVDLGPDKLDQFHAQHGGAA
jgi:hypothetical protein